MEVLLIILGAFLAVGGSFLAQRNQILIDQEDKDRSIILEVISILLDYHSSGKALAGISKELPIPSTITQIYDHEHEMSECLHKLSYLALQIRSKKYFGLAVKLTKFALDKQIRTDENLYYLTKIAQESVNAELIAEYEKQIKQFPSKL